MSYQVLTLVLARCLRNHSFSLREALVNKSPTLSLRHETIMIPKGSPKGFAYAAIHVVSSCSCKEQHIRTPYTTRVFNMELTQPYASQCFPYATD